MKVVVTGATGGLGRAIIENLSTKKDLQLVALGRNQKIGRELEALRVKFLPGSITDTTYLKSAFTGADVVIHCAGLATPGAHKQRYEEVNIKGTQSVLSALAGRAEIKLISLSTPSIYFSGLPRTDIKESDPLPKSYKYHYPRTKLCADKLIIDQRPRNSILLRPRAIIGKYDRTILPKILKLMRKGYFLLPDAGSAKVDFTATQNVVHAIWLIMSSKKSFYGDIYNVTNNEPIPLQELMELIQKKFGLRVKYISIPKSLLLSLAQLCEVIAPLFGSSEPFLTRYGVHSIGTTQTLSTKKIQEELGYTPVISLEDALSKLAKNQRG